jgi:hypothetical protein
LYGQQAGDEAGDLLRVVDEEADDLADEPRRTPVILKHL